MLDGVALGRMAVVRPWIFSVFSQGFSPDQGIFERHAYDYLDRLEAHFEPHIAVKLFKKSAIYYAANFKFGHSIWSTLVKGDHLENIRANIGRLFETHPEISDRPNMNLMI
ncbi:MAG: hypothetical protein M0Z56_06195 [Desulfobacteraceae bacterium]|nr:hypothetical protein [Desulfobacteraceae bacterium]